MFIYQKMSSLNVDVVKYAMVCFRAWSWKRKGSWPRPRFEIKWTSPGRCLSALSNRFGLKEFEGGMPLLVLFK